jgi:hypothetical protein
MKFVKPLLAEVNDWYEDLRPTEPQIPIRDLSITEIMPLDDISFEMSTSFGAKCSNVATMRSFDLSLRERFQMVLEFHFTIMTNSCSSITFIKRHKS